MNWITKLYFILIAIALLLSVNRAILSHAQILGDGEIFKQLLAPDGIATDSNGNVFVFHGDTSGLRLVVTKFSPDGVVLGSVPIGGAMDLFSARLATNPGTGMILALLSTGRLLQIHPETGAASELLDLRSPNLSIDASAVYDIESRTVQNFSGFILKNNIHYGDLAVLKRGNQIDLFVTGVSIVTPFVMRIRMLPNTPVNARVVVSSLSVGDFFNSPRGVGVNSQGTVLTTLPKLGATGAAIDMAVTFNADFEAGTGTVPNPSILFDQKDILSRGMTADAAGNFYVATGAIGTSLCGASSRGELVIIPPSLNTSQCLTLGVALADSLDVAVNPANNRAYMTVRNLGAVVSFSLRTDPGSGPVCDVQLSQTAYNDGSTVTIQALRLANLGTNPLPVEIKLWLGWPGGAPISFANVGSDGSVALPPGYDQSFGPSTLFTVTAQIPRGLYELGCRGLDPVTGRLLSEDLNPFTIQ